MLEHADRDDAVEVAGDLAIVLELEVHRAGEAFLGGALLRDLELLGAERDAGHVAVGRLGEIEPEPAPARADVEHALAGLDGELGRDVALLGELRRIEVVVLGLEVAAGILPVAIEEQVVDGAIDVVVVGHVAPRAARRIELQHAPDEIAGGVEALVQAGNCCHWALLRISSSRS